MTRTIYTNVPQGRTHQATAEAIHHHLVAHPDQRPNDDNQPAHPIFRIDHSETVIQFSTLTPGTLTAFPGTATADYEANDRTAFTSDNIGLGVLVHEEGLVEDEASRNREAAIHHIRLVVMRAIRYRNKQAARRAA